LQFQEGVAAADGTFHTLRLEIKSGGIQVYVDNVAKTPITSNIPTVSLGLAMYSSSVATSGGMYADYVEVVQDR